MVVHCSAGIGRSGAFIVCDMICDLIKKNGHQSIINIKDAVKHCRQVTDDHPRAARTCSDMDFGHMIDEEFY